MPDLTAALAAQERAQQTTPPHVARGDKPQE